MKSNFFRRAKLFVSTLFTITFVFTAGADEMAILKSQSEGKNETISRIKKMQTGVTTKVGSFQCWPTVDERAFLHESTISYSISCDLSRKKEKLIVSSGWGKCSDFERNIKGEGSVVALEMEVLDQKDKYSIRVHCKK